MSPLHCSPHQSLSESDTVTVCQLASCCSLLLSATSLINTVSWLLWAVVFVALSYAHTVLPILLFSF